MIIELSQDEARWIDWALKSTDGESSLRLDGERLILPDDSRKDAPAIASLLDRLERVAYDLSLGYGLEEMIARFPDEMLALSELMARREDARRERDEDASKAAIKLRYLLD